MHSGIKKLWAILVMLCLCLPFTAQAAGPADYEVAHPENLISDYLYDTGCVVMNADTGDILFEKNGSQKLYPASTTKIVTCILAIEWAESNGMLGKTITIPAGITVDSSQSRMKLTEGDQMTFEDLLYGMMIASGNDAAQAVAVLVAGSTTEFVRLMNSFVEELGISSSSTHFTNVTGLHDVNHFTTARDLAKIMAYCVQNDTFRLIIACPEYTVYSTFWPDGTTFTSKYDLIDSTKSLYYKPCIGGKTGYTSKAGRSFVGAAQQDDITLVSVSLDPPDMNGDPKDYFETFTDTIRLFKYGFLQYDTLSFKQMLTSVATPKFHSVQVVRPIASDENGGLLEWSVTGIPAEYSESYLKSDLSDEESRAQIRKDFEERVMPYFIKTEAPIEQNEIIGRVEFAGKDGEVYEGTIVALRSVQREPDTADEAYDKWVNSNLPQWVTYLMPRYYPIAWVLYIVLAAALVALFVYVSSRRAKRNRARRKALEAKRREYLRRMQREEYLRKHPEARQQMAARRAQQNASKTTHTAAKTGVGVKKTSSSATGVHKSAAPSYEKKTKTHTGADAFTSKQAKR